MIKTNFKYRITWHIEATGQKHQEIISPEDLEPYELDTKIQDLIDGGAHGIRIHINAE